MQAMAIRIPAKYLMALMCLAVLLPVAAFLVYAFSGYSADRKAIIIARVGEIADGIAANVDRELKGMVATANALAISPTLQTGDLEAFHAEAVKIVPFSQANVLLIGKDMQILVHTRLPWGSPLPKTSAVDATTATFATGKPQVSGVFIGKISKQLVFNVSFPVSVGGTVKYVLVLTAESTRFTDLLREQNLAAGFVAVLYDGQRNAIASSAGAMPPPWPSEAELLVKPGGPHSLNLLGEDVVAATASSVLSDWQLLVWAPSDVLFAPVTGIWRNLLQAGILAALAVLGLVYVFSSALTNLIRQTVAAARRVGTEREIPSFKSMLSESAAISQRLDEANREVLARQKEAMEGRALLDTLLAHVPDGITVVGGPEMKVIANSRQAVEWIGRPAASLAVGAEAQAAAFGISRPDGSVPAYNELPLYRASRNGENISGESYMVTRPDGTELLIDVSVNPVRNADGAIIGAVSCWRDITEKRREQIRLEESDHRLRLALSVARMAIYDVSLLGEGAANVINSREIFGADFDGINAAEANTILLSIVHESDRPRLTASWQRSALQLGPFSDEFRVVKPSGEMLWIEARGEVLPDATGAPARWLGTNSDVTHRKRTEQQIRLISRELTHRVKNVLTVVQGLAGQSARHATTVDAFLEAFSARLQGMSASHDLLLATNWSGVQLNQLVEAQLKPFGGSDSRRVTISGEDGIILKTDILQALGLAFHELATNAVKYGALSVEGGRVDVNWVVDPEGLFRLWWRETGGPPVKEPRRKGFGHVLTVRSLASVVGGKVDISFDKRGIVWMVEAPLDQIQLADGDAAD